MATNEVFDEPDQLSLPVTSGTLSGSPVIVGSIPGVALTDAATTTKFGGGNAIDSATVQISGVFTLQVTGAVTPGAPVYITAGYALNVTNTNALFGYALDTKGASIGPVRVLIARV